MGRKRQASPTFASSLGSGRSLSSPTRPEQVEIGESAHSPPSSSCGSPSTPRNHTRSYQDGDEDPNDKLSALRNTDILTTPPKGEDARLRTSFVMRDDLYNVGTKNLPSLANDDRNSIAPILPVGSSQTAAPSRGGDGSSARGLVANRAPSVVSGGSVPASNDTNYKSHVSDWLATGSPEIRRTRLQNIPTTTLQMPGAFPNSFTRCTSPTESTSTIKDSTILAPQTVDEKKTPSKTKLPASSPNPAPTEPKPPRIKGYKKPNEGFGLVYSRAGTESRSTESDGDTVMSEHDEEKNQEHVINPDTSFDDKLVYRGMSDFSFHKPTPLLRCTTAGISETIAAQQAMSILLRHAESAFIYETLSNRIERMLTDRLAKSTTARGTLKRGHKVPSVYECATKLRDYLKKEVDNRAELGECRRFLEHEVEWAGWFVKSSETKVLHLKVKGCTCKPEWSRKWGDPLEELEEEEEGGL
ncbi:hypothetical protein P280DRAFT_519782 [Massarina eburnea CBS 473.64]|uniref:Uncharacterized protein n=1 Tax=Massarina eburnea CBS 473.64 TaxID=1395130 RepID=A0A6A6RW11_9PLEO|nr:hypothetical protein P280DRAFT_519782 [Massarina eburnea CBS 473.64]